MGDFHLFLILKFSVLYNEQIHLWLLEKVKIQKIGDRQGEIIKKYSEALESMEIHEVGGFLGKFALSKWLPAERA